MHVHVRVHVHVNTAPRTEAVPAPPGTEQRRLSVEAAIPWKQDVTVGAWPVGGRGEGRVDGGVVVWRVVYGGRGGGRGCRGGAGWLEIWWSSVTTDS